MIKKIGNPSPKHQSANNRYKNLGHRRVRTVKNDPTAEELKLDASY